MAQLAYLLGLTDAAKAAVDEQASWNSGIVPAAQATPPLCSVQSMLHVQAVAQHVRLLGVTAQRIDPSAEQVRSASAKLGKAAQHAATAVTSVGSEPRHRSCICCTVRSPHAQLSGQAVPEVCLERRR